MTSRKSALLLFSLVLMFSCVPLYGQQPGRQAPGSMFVYTADGISSEVSGFSAGIDGTLTPVPGSPYSVPGEFPVSVAPTSLAYMRPYLVVAGANAETSTGISVFKLDSSTGALTSIPNGPPLTTFVDYGFIVGDNRNHMVYAIGENNDAPQQLGLSSFKLSASGKLKQIGPIIYPGSPTQGPLALDPLGRFLYVLDIYPGGGLYVYRINTDGTLGNQVPGSPFVVGDPMTINGPDDPNACVFWSADQTLVTSPNGKYLYISCTDGRQVTQLGVSPRGKVAVKNYIPLTDTGNVLSSLAIDKSGKFLFGTEENQNSVLAFSLDPSTGVPTQVDSSAAGTRPNSVVASPNDSYLYVTNGSSNVYKGNNYPGSDNLSYYSLSPSGSLTPVPGSPIVTGQGPRSVVAIRP